MTSLVMTPYMIGYVRSKSAMGVVDMDPLDFLSLTSCQTTMDVVAESETLDTYNRLALDGKVDGIPWLDIDLDTGLICGHEGRHRASALSVAGGTTMCVAVVPYVNEKSVSPYAARKLHASDLPSRWSSQFSTTVFNASAVLRTFRKFS